MAIEPKNQKSSATVDAESCDLGNFRSEVLGAYLKGKADGELPADSHSARSLIPPGTAAARSFAAIASEFPAYHADKCVACMECVMVCPDAAVHGRVTPQTELEGALAKAQTVGAPASIKAQFAKTDKFWKVYEKKGEVPAYFSIWIDPDKCKGCAECVSVCTDSGHNALTMEEKTDEQRKTSAASYKFSTEILPRTPQKYINPKLHTDLFLMEDAWPYVGGAGSCMGCGEITALKMAMTTTMAKYGKNMVIVASTGCNSVFSSTYPFNIFNVPWTNSLFENGPTTALGVRMRLNQEGKRDTKVWVVGGDGAMNDIGFQALSRALCTGEDIKILVLDTQVYSNTGGQASTATFMGQSAKMSMHGKASTGKVEQRKELGLISMMHPEVFVAQVSTSYYNHFLRAVSDALEFPGPAVIIAYAPCMPEHGIADNAAFAQAKAAVQSRAFPIYVHDPRKGRSIKERLDLRGNPSISEDWHKDPKTGEVYDFTWFAKQEERFSHQFNAEGRPSEALLMSQADRLSHWNKLRELAGLVK
ncbi:MAG: thiamine pyrophosphate-dependent enzyme [Oligoflexia bacterium]|nr:thiamine pyrophosphate-dependent enzyme [Oligoflexia bacterium]